MYEIQITSEYKRWIGKLRDEKARARIDIRIRRLASGNPGDARFVGDGVMELKIDYGPGYRVYYKRKRGMVILLLVGGDKRTQLADIRAAIALAKSHEEAP
jgi:putative addiction module killer protein